MQHFYSFVSQVCHCWCPPFSAGHVAFLFMCSPSSGPAVSAFALQSFTFVTQLWAAVSASRLLSFAPSGLCLAILNMCLPTLDSCLCLSLATFHICLPALGCMSLAILYTCLPALGCCVRLWLAILTFVSQLWAAVSASALQSLILHLSFSSDCCVRLCP